MNLPRLLVILCVSICSLGLAAPRALAQSGGLGPGIIRSSDLSQADKDAIKKFIDQHKDGLLGTPAEIKKSRTALLEQLRDAQVSIQFRLEYTRQLLPVLRPLAANAKAVVAINALEVCGELATAASIDLLVDALKDKRRGVRYVAATGFQHTFEAVQRTAPAIGGAVQALKTLDTLQKALETETDPHVMEGLVNAFQAVTNVPGKQVDGMRGAGVSALTKAISAKTADRTLSPQADPALRRAILTVRNAVTNANANINEDSLKPDVLRSAAAMAGDLLALVYERFKANTVAPDDQDDLAVLVADSERSIYFIVPQLGGNSGQELKLDALVQQGKGDEYRKQVMQLIGPNGLLTGTTFGFPKDRFIKDAK